MSGKEKYRDNQLDRDPSQVSHYERSQDLFRAVDVQPVSGIGRGLFLAEGEQPLKPGDEILSFTGPFVSQQDASDYSLQVSIDPPVFLETDPSHDYENYINHRCTLIPSSQDCLDDDPPQPNCKIVIRIRRDKHSLIGSTSSFSEVMLVATRDIQPGEQLFFDYATTEVNMTEAGGDFVCTCGSPSCRCQDGESLVGADKLTPAEARYLLDHDLLADHVLAILIEKWGIAALRREPS